jgi:cyclophilin family peptidyl-prolyl cis-trans isomerase
VFAPDGSVLESFYAYDQRYGGGVYVADPDLTADGHDDIVTGAGAGGTSHVRAFNSTDQSILASFNAFAPDTPVGPFSTQGTTNPPPGGDTTPPVVQITEPPPSQISTNTIIGGVATDVGSGVAFVTAKLDKQNPVDLTVFGGRFSYPTGLKTDGSNDGTHTVTFVAHDNAGNVSQPVIVTFTLNTQGLTVNFDLDPTSDTGPKGDQRTDQSTVILSGHTEAGATVTLVQTGAQTTAGADGTFSFAGINLHPGPNTFVVQARDAQSKTGQQTLVINLNSAPTVGSAVANFQVSAGAQDTIINLPGVFDDRDVNSVVHFDTSSGGFDVQLFDQQTPQTVQNFFKYVTSGRYADTIFHRTVPNFVIQGGGFQFHANPSSLPAVPTDPAVVNEPLLSNQLGTIAMAKLGGNPNSATSQFFFNLADNSRGTPQLDTQNGGFTAFGSVLGSGMQTVNQLAAIPTQDRSGGDPSSPFGSIPLQNYPQPPAGNFPADTTAANYALVNNVTVTRTPGIGNLDALTFAVVSNTNTGLVSATITSGGQLVLHYTAGQTGSATITLRATDKTGDQATTSFTVTVA